MTFCPSCGGTDHARASSAKCANRKKRLRETDVPDGSCIEVYNVKRGLTSLLCPTLGRELRDEYLANIRRDVRDVSRLSVELSYLVNFFYKSYAAAYDRREFYELFPKFDPQQFANALKDNARKTGGVTDPLGKLDEYRSMNGGTLYEGRLRSYSVIWAARRYATLLETNIVTHAFGRVKRYMNVLYGADSESALSRKEVHDRCFANFYKPATVSPSECPIREWLRNNDLSDTNVRLNYWRYVHTFLRLQKALYEAGESGKRVSSFNVFPIYRHGLKYLQYDSMCLYELMRRTEPSHYRTPMAEFKADRPAAWRRLFDLGRLARNFGYSISTDGEAVNLSMNRIVRKPPTGVATVKKKRKTDGGTGEESRTQRPLSEYDRVIAVDPGAKTPVVTCTRSGNDFAYGVLSKGTVSSWTNERHRRRKRLAVTREIDEAVRLDMESSEVEISAKSPHVSAFTAFHLKWFDRKQGVYETRKLQRLKFDKYMNDRKCTEKIVDRFFVRDERGARDRKEKILVVYGSGVDFINRASFKGHRKFRHGDLEAALRRRENVEFVKCDESYTTKTCSHCYERTGERIELTVSKSPHRYVYCSNCRKGAHRDKNAAKNILLKFEKGQKPTNGTCKQPCPTSVVVVGHRTVDHKVESRNP